MACIRPYAEGCENNVEGNVIIKKDEGQAYTTQVELGPYSDSYL